MQQQEKRLSPGLLILILMTIAVFIAGFWFLNSRMKEKKIDLEKALSALKSETIFSRVDVLSLDADKITIRFRIPDIDGRIILQKDFTLPGKDIYLESRIGVVEANGVERAFVFPYRIYSEKLPATEGRHLFPFYIKNGFPENYRTSVENPDLVELVKKVFAAVTNDAEEAVNTVSSAENNPIRIRMSMDAVLHQAAFQDFLEGGSYEYIAHPNGGLEMREMK